MDNLSVKTKIFNTARKAFMHPIAEKCLIKLMEKYNGHPLVSSLLPSNYLYPLHSIRKTCDRKIHFELDLYNWNDWEVYFHAHPRGLDKLFRLCNPHDVVIDIGSNIGFVLMNMAERVGPEGRVYGFEPNLETFHKLQHNLSLNHFSNITVRQAAMGDVMGKAETYSVRSSNLGMNKIRLLSTEDSTASVPVLTLDHFCEKEEMTRVDMIKIDVEGYEQKVLEGSIETLRKFNPLLFIELSCENLREQNSTPGQILQILHSLGYSVKRATDNLDLMPDYPFDEDCHFDIIAIPPGRYI